MKKIQESQMINIQGGKDGQDFVSGFLCAAGLLTSTTGLGLSLAILGCGSLIGDW